ncbi:unnamed protein product [Durusdinium trenchii]|uniref:Uncharacterized protein n=2 Tax=Durusdinium trenchii TaxID=1381693 RepID=A0ABP0PWE4_9DINO
MSSSSQDWPLSKEEQKRRIIRLYDKDVKAANQLLNSGEAALKQAIKELHQELKAARADGRHQKVDLREPVATQLQARNVEAPPYACEETKPSKSDADFEHAACEPLSPANSDVDETSDGADADRDGAAEAAARLQNVIVDAAATLASLFGTSSLSSVLVGIAEGADEDADRCSEVRQRAKSEGCRVIASEPIREDRRRRKSRGGVPLKVSFAEPEVEDVPCRRRPSIAEPEPSPSNSPREAALRPVASPQMRNAGLRVVTRRSRRGRAPAPASSAPRGMLDFI